MTKTVKVRIAVAVDPSGNWESCGWRGSSDEEAMDVAVESVGTSEARYLVTAELPIPEAVEVAGKVEGGRR